MSLNVKRLIGGAAFGIAAGVALVSCGSKDSSMKWAKGTSNETIIKEAAAAGKVGNWGLGNEYEILALLQKYGQSQSYIQQPFTMDCFDTGTVALASAMTYNELGLVKNDYSNGNGLAYGDKVGTIDMNDEGVAMLEDNIFTTKKFAQQNPNTVKAFVYASLRGWAYAVDHTAEAAEICYEYGQSVEPEHQAYMASEVAKLVKTDTKGQTVTNYGNIDSEAITNTLTLAKKYITLTDSTAAAKLNNMTTSDFATSDYMVSSLDGLGEIEKKSVSIQLKWLPDAQFMGYYVALKKGYYTEAGFTNVTIVEGGGSVSETVNVTAGTYDFGTTWVSNLIATNAAASAADELLEVAQVFQRSGLVLVYKYE